MGFELVVLGASGTFPTPGSACAGYLLRSDGSDVWVDSGPGTFANLQRHTRFWELSGLVLSHLHPDHVLDLFPFYYALRFSEESGGRTGVPVWAPEGAEDHLARVISIEREADFGEYLEFRSIGEGAKASIGPFEFSFARAVHPIETLMMRITAGGRTLAYTADTGPGEHLSDFVAGADTLVCEATLHDPVEELNEVHLTAEQAGQLAAKAGVGRLVLTHIWPALDAERSAALARRRFDGEVVVARDNLSIEV
ncbi:MAG: MBL fold metallo-hydrolase [Actinomycetota bacterium]